MTHAGASNKSLANYFASYNKKQAKKSAERNKKNHISKGRGVSVKSSTSKKHHHKSSSSKKTIKVNFKRDDQGRVFDANLAKNKGREGTRLQDMPSSKKTTQQTTTVQKTPDKVAPRTPTGQQLSPTRTSRAQLSSVPVGFWDYARFGGGISVDPRAIKSKTMRLVTNAEGRVSGIIDAETKQTIGFSGRGITQQEVLKEEYSRNKQRIMREREEAERRRRTQTVMTAAKKTRLRDLKTPKQVFKYITSKPERDLAKIEKEYTITAKSQPTTFLGKTTKTTKMIGLGAGLIAGDFVVGVRSIAKPSTYKGIYKLYKKEGALGLARSFIPSRAIQYDPVARLREQANVAAWTLGGVFLKEGEIAKAGSKASKLESRFIYKKPKATSYAEQIGVERGSLFDLGKKGKTELLREQGAAARRSIKAEEGKKPIDLSRTLDRTDTSMRNPYVQARIEKELSTADKVKRGEITLDKAWEELTGKKLGRSEFKSEQASKSFRELFAPESFFEIERVGKTKPKRVMPEEFKISIERVKPQKEKHLISRQNYLKDKIQKKELVLTPKIYEELIGKTAPTKSYTRGTKQFRELFSPESFFEIERVGKPKIKNNFDFSYSKRSVNEFSKLFSEKPKNVISKDLGITIERTKPKKKRIFTAKDLFKEEDLKNAKKVGGGQKQELLMKMEEPKTKKVVELKLKDLEQETKKKTRSKQKTREKYGSTTTDLLSEYELQRKVMSSKENLRTFQRGLMLSPLRIITHEQRQAITTRQKPFMLTKITKTNFKQVVDQLKKTGMAQKQAQDQQQIFDTRSLSDVATKQIQTFKSQTILKSRYEFKQEKNKLPKIEFKHKKKKKKFFIEVRKKGRWERMAIKSGTTEALRLGKSIVGNTAAASFRLIDASSGYAAKIKANIGKDFYISTKEKGVFIEKLGRRIKSGGELKEITKKGIIASRNKRGKFKW